MEAVVSQRLGNSSLYLNFDVDKHKEFGYLKYITVWSSDGDGGTVELKIPFYNSMLSDMEKFIAEVRKFDKLLS